MELLIKQDKEVLQLRTQLQNCADDLRRCQQVLRDKEQGNSRLSRTVSDLRDAAIQRELELTALKQALGSRDADAACFEQQQRNTEYTLQKDLQMLQLDLEEEKAKRMDLADGKNRMEHDLRQQLRDMMGQNKAEQVSRKEAESREQALQAKVDELQGQLLAKSRDVDAAVNALGMALTESQQLQDSHRQALHNQERHIRELQAQVLLLSESEATRSSEQQQRLSALISSFNQLRETCEQQAAEINQLTAEKRRLEEDKRRLKERLTQTTALASSLKADKDQVNAALNQQTSNLNSAQLELSIAQHQAREAAVRANSLSMGDRKEEVAQFNRQAEFFGGPSFSTSHFTSPRPSTAADNSTHTILRAHLALSKLRSSVGGLTTASPTASPNKGTPLGR